MTLAALHSLIIFSAGAAVGTTAFVALWSGILTRAAAAAARRLLPLGPGHRALRRRPHLPALSGHKPGGHRYRPAHQRRPAMSGR